MGNNVKHFGGSREHELKTFLGTRGFINGEQAINLKGLRDQENMYPPPPWEGLSLVVPASTGRPC